MRKIRLLVAYLHAGSMDLLVGAFLITALTRLFDIPFEWWYLLLGAALTVLPDFDTFLPLLKRLYTGTPIVGDHHKTWLHYPAVVLPVIGGMFYTLGGFEWAVIAVAGVLAHYIHDALTIERGGFYWLVRTERTTWKNRVAETPNDVWIEKNWLQWSKLSVVETTVGAAATLGTLAIIFSRT